jgi:hypothetical protein
MSKATKLFNGWPTWVAGVHVDGRTAVAAAVGRPGPKPRYEWCEEAYLGDSIEVSGKRMLIKTPQEAAIAAGIFAALHGPQNVPLLLYSDVPEVVDAIVGTRQTGELERALREILMRSGSDVMDYERKYLQLVYDGAEKMLAEAIRRGAPRTLTPEGTPEERASATALFDDPAQRHLLTDSLKAVLDLERSGLIGRKGFRRGPRGILDVVWVASEYL